MNKDAAEVIKAGIVALNDPVYLLLPKCKQKQRQDIQDAWTLWIKLKDAKWPDDITAHFLENPNKSDTDRVYAKDAAIAVLDRLESAIKG